MTGESSRDLFVLFSVNNSPKLLDLSKIGKTGSRSDKQEVSDRFPGSCGPPSLFGGVTLTLRWSRALLFLGGIMAA